MGLYDRKVIAMKFPMLKLLVGVGLFLPVVGSASLLGSADPYNVLFFDHMNSKASDTEGRVAVGGDVNLINYSIGLKSPVADYSLVAGGDVKFWSGSILHGGVYGGDSITIDKAGSISGDVISNGAITLTGGTTMTGDKNSYAGVTSPLNFASAYTELAATADYLAGLSVTGATVNKYNTFYFDAANAGLNVFSMTSTELKNSVGMKFNLGTGSAAVINISGSYNDFSGFGFMDFSGKSLLKEIGQNILFNFFETTALDVNAIGVMGSILAPDAKLYFNNGVINGSVVAKSMDGSGQFNYNPFQYTSEKPKPIPEPRTLVLMGLGLALLLVMRKRMA
jgi:choice-of-anchor A domain-containing protein